MIGEWTNPHSLITPEGTLPFNETDPDTGWRFQLNERKCQALLPVRSTEDDVPQGDGKIPHRRWRSGYGVHLAIEPMVGDDGCAAGADLVGMLDLLGLHLNAMIRTGLVSGFPNARLVFTPSGGTSPGDDRMFDRCQLQGTPTPTFDGDLGGIQVEVDIDTPYPYYISAEETDTVLYQGGTDMIVPIFNAGNTDYFPVVELYGPASLVVVTNYSIVDLSNIPLQLFYDASLPNASAIDPGDYVEVTFFEGKAYLNGNQAPRKSGLDFRYTEFFPLIPGENLVGVFGGDALVKSNSAWA